MKVTPVSTTAVIGFPEGIDWDATPDSPERAVTDADFVGEFAGRACYKSWSKPNPATAANSDYLANIIRQGHFSVLEHASASFYVEGVSRALLLELERHRFLSFSVESQRYVDQTKSHPEPVIPPAMRDNAKLTRDFQIEYRCALDAYRAYVSMLEGQGFSRKQAREAARGVLPNATPVDFLVTGNLRAWRDVLGKRHHMAADAEIREFAGLVLGHLRNIAPNSVQDIPEKPYE
ncbi:FAD-dependent thymidylate synthase [Streptomyces sp. NPDC085866]|uniref:FAD-dependent thymidylate synthase n=1 Tax=Streptomyces sp. NPDC085866 TaxID=3365736 RepID=UPI0037D0A977